MKKPMKRLVFLMTALLAVPLVATLARSEEGEKRLKQSDVPKPVLEKVKQKYPKAKLLGFEQENDKGKTIFEIELKDGGRKIDVDFSPDGKILAEEILLKTSELPAEVKTGLSGSKYAKWSIKKAERIITEENEAAPTYEVLVAGTGGDKGKMMEVELDKAGKITKEELKTEEEDD